MNTLGLKDVPLDNLENESLGLRSYAEALADFVRQCDTPITIALQGDWGSGKTSMMNLIKASLDADRDKIKPIWFNTWQYSQFGMEDDLAVSLISFFLNALEAGENARKLVSGFMGAARKVVGALPTLAGTIGGGVAENVTKAMTDLLASDAMDTAAQIVKLKSAIDLAASKVPKRIVVFVDDLDRLLPERAVELLEVFKLFLDVRGCVFILACDYQVVTQGLRKKFNLGPDELKGRSFFDKIIQLPFSMPVGQYDVRHYIEDLLKRIGFEHEESDLTDYVDLVKYSVGFNPRSLKRLFNSLLLLNIVAEKNQLFQEQEEAKKSERQKVLFGVLCLQTAYELVYRYLLSHYDDFDHEFISKFTDERSFDNDDELKELSQQLESGAQVKIAQLSRFMGALFKALQLESDGDSSKLSESEVRNLRSVMTFSALTSTDSIGVQDTEDREHKRANRRYGKTLAESFSSDYSKHLARLGTEFSVYQSHSAADVCVYCEFNLPEMPRFELDLSFGEDWNDGVPYCSAYFNCKVADRAPVRTWIEAKIGADFPETRYLDRGWDYVELWIIEFDKSTSEAERKKIFEDRARATLDVIMPKAGA